LLDVFSSTTFTILAGEPATTTPLGTSSVTIAPAATTDPLPILTLFYTRINIARKNS